MLGQLKHTELKSAEEVLEFFNEHPAHKVESITQNKFDRFNVFYRDILPCECYEEGEEWEEE